MPWLLKDWQIIIDIDDWWWDMVKVVGGEMCKFKAKNASAIFAGRKYCTVIC